MPFIITEPQKIDGTILGFAIYPYHFSFQDRFEKKREFNQKLLIFVMKDSPFNEISHVVFENKYSDAEVSRNYVDKKLKNFIDNNPKYVVNPELVDEFFYSSIHYCDKNELKKDL